MSQTSTSTWERTKGYSKRSLDKAWHQLDKIGKPANRLSNRLGAEAFWPTTLDKESDKAARILRSFCKDGFYGELDSEIDLAKAVEPPSENGWLSRRNSRQQQLPEGAPKGKQRVMKRIPASVIRQAKGLAIFTTMRTGLWMSGAGGSGVLVARLAETGEWSPPSGIMLHTAGLGFLVGVDIYDCVVVINTHEALDAFKSVRCTLGGSLSAVAGPVGIGGIVDSEVVKRRAPVWSYLKSRGLYAGVQVDGTIIIERTDENERFYGEKIGVSDILCGKAKNPPASIRTLTQTIKAAQGDQNVDEGLLPPPGETPGDTDISLAGTFGVPEEDDPDPYGVKALEREGVIIREAGTKKPPALEVFEFRPSPTSPISPRWSGRSSWRFSTQSAMSTDKGTQTNLHEVQRTRSPSPVSRASSHSIKDVSSSFHEHTATESDTEHSFTDEPDPASIPIPISTATSRPQSVSFRSPEASTEALPESFPESIPEIAEAEIAMAVKEHPVPQQPNSKSPPFARAKLVTIPKRHPPALPARNPSRSNLQVSTISEARNSGLLSLSLDSEATHSGQLLAGEISNESDVETRRASSHSSHTAKRSSASPKSPLSQSVFIASQSSSEGGLTNSKSSSPASKSGSVTEVKDKKGENGEEEPGKNKAIEEPPLTTGAFPSEEGEA